MEQAAEDKVGTDRSRRAFLRVGLALPAVGLLAACGTSRGAAQSGADSTASGAASTTALSSPTSAARAAPPAATSTVATPTNSAAGTTSPTSATSGAATATVSQATPTASTSAAPATAATCVLSAEETEGPYYIDGALTRSDITERKPGLPLQLRFTVMNVASCAALPNATVDIWHCDASGVYSGYSAATPGGPGGPPPGGGHVAPTNKETFLRGNQPTDATGAAVFQTIYPGWYTGRTTHIHVKVHVGGNVVHTGQLYMTDALTDSVYAQAPYAAHGKRDTTNATDGIYAQGGTQSMLAMTKSGAGHIGAITLGVGA